MPNGIVSSALTSAMSWSELAGICSVLSFAGVVLGGGLLYYFRTSFVTSRVFASFRKDNEARLDRMDGRITINAEHISGIQTAMTNLPTQADIQRVSDKVSSISGDLKAVTASIDGIKASLTQIQKPLDLLLAHQINAGG